MTYTTQQLQGMSDFEVNKALAEKFGIEVRKGFDGTSSVAMLVDNRYWRAIDYCNNPNDIMPLAFERSICLIQTDIGKELGEWVAFTWIGNNEQIDKNPLRAIACLLLMMED